MTSFLRVLKLHYRRFINDQSGASAIEYAIIAGLIAAAIIVLVGTLGDQIVELFTRITASLTAGGVTGD